MGLQQIFKKVISKLKTPEQIDKEIREKSMKEQIGISDADLAYVKDPKFTAQINFENFKAVFKRDPAISRSGFGGGIETNKFKIERLRESDVDGNIVNSIDSIRIRDNSHNKQYFGMINRAYGIKAVRQNGFIYMAYDMKTIEKDRMRERKNE